MSYRAPHEAQATNSVPLILTFLFCLALTFSSALGFVVIRVSSAQRGALDAAEREAMLAAKAQAEAYNAQLRAMELARQAEDAKQKDDRNSDF